MHETVVDLPKWLAEQARLEQMVIYAREHNEPAELYLWLLGQHNDTLYICQCRKCSTNRGN